MTIEVHANQIDAFHWIVTPTADGQDLVTLSGVAKVNFRADSAREWRHEEILIHLPPPPVKQTEAGKVLWHTFESLNQWAPMVTLSSIFAPASGGAGWAVDAYDVIPHEEEDGIRPILRAHVAVRIVDGWLYKLGFHITLLGKLKLNQQDA